MSIITVNKFVPKIEEEDFDDLEESIVTPGELITEENVWMRGHGTYSLNQQTYSSLEGTILKVNKLLSVKPLKGRYTPETGDHVIGRILEVGHKRWKVDIGAKNDGVLLLGSVNLPGGILRRKSDNDELTMRNLLKEGDLLNCEIQNCFNDGSASLHTRSLKYGKLKNGIFLQVPKSLIIKSKNHSLIMSGNVSIILGVNGYIWIYKTMLNNKSTNPINNKLPSGILNSDYKIGNSTSSIVQLEENSSWEIYSDLNDKEINQSIKENIIRYKMVLLALSQCNIGINEPRIILGYEISLVFELNELSNVLEQIGQDILNAEKMRGF